MPLPTALFTLGLIQCQRRLHISKVENIGNVFELSGVAFRLAPPYGGLIVRRETQGTKTSNNQTTDLFPWYKLSSSATTLRLVHRTHGLIARISELCCAPKRCKIGLRGI